MVRKREADKVEVPPIPSCPDGGDWIRQLEKNVVAASSSDHPRQVLYWINECTDPVEDPDSYFSFDKCPRRYQSLDTKLAVAIMEKVRESRMQGLRLAVEKLDEDASYTKPPTLLSGRRVVHEVARRLEICDGQGLQHSTVDLVEMKFPVEDTNHRIEGWARAMEKLIKAAMREGMPGPACYATLREKLKHSKRLEARVLAWENATPLRSDRTWRALLAVVHGHLEEWHWELQRAEAKEKLRSSFAGSKKEPRPAAAVESAGATGGKAQSKGGSKGKGKPPPPTVAKDGYKAVLEHYQYVCRDHVLSSNCNRGSKCDRSHEAMEPDEQLELRLAIQARRDATGGSRPSSPAGSPRSSGADSDSESDAKSKQLCFSVARSGTCNRGDRCPYLHAETASERARTEPLKHLRKGKGGGKRGKADAAVALQAHAAWEPES